jgi:hypothetical protein
MALVTRAGALDSVNGQSHKLFRTDLHIAMCDMRPHENLQLKLIRSLPNGNEFVSFIDAIGEIDGQRHLIDWKITTSG